MHDRIPRYPGRVTMTPVSGMTNTYDMARADDPEQDGTPLNKETFLTDETAALFGLTDSAVPDDVFKELADSPNKVGDIKTTTRTDLGDNWLLCNGEKIALSKYPELAAVLTQNFDWTYLESENMWQSPSSTANSTTTNVFNAVTYANGYWVLCGQHYDGSKYYARIAYATSLGGEWTVKDLWSSTSAGSVNCVAYADGYWVAGGRAYSSTYCGRIAYATSLGGEWTTVDPANWIGNSTADTTTAVNCVAYADGYWVIGGTKVQSYSYAMLAYATSPDGTWTQKELWYHSNSSVTGNKLMSLAYGNGYWVAGGVYASGTSTFYSQIAYATSPGGDWTLKRLTSSYASTSYPVNGIAYADGMWAAVYSTTVAYATSPDGTWTTNAVADAGELNGVAYAGGLWLLTSSDRDANAVFYAASPDGVFQARKLWDSGRGFAKGIAYENGSWCIVGQQVVSSLNNAAIAYSLGDGQLPIIESCAYAYIKAKEASAGSDTLTWDGNTEGLVSVDLDGSGSVVYYRVSDVVLTMADVESGFVVSTDGSADLFTAEDVILLVGGSFYISIGGFPVVMSIDDSAIGLEVSEGVSFTETGVYFLENIRSLTINGYTGF